MANPLSAETTANIRDALSAGRKLDAVRIYCEATGTSLSEAKAFVDRLEAGSVTMSDAAPADARSKSLTDFGWHVEMTDDGDVRLRRSALWRGARIGCSFGILVLFSPVVVGFLYAGRGFSEGPLDGGAGRVFTLLISLFFVGSFGLFLAALLFQMLRLALWREEWDATQNRLTVRRGLLRFLRRRDFNGGELLLEPHFEQDRHAQQWRLAVICDGEKHYLLREPDIGVGFHSMDDSHAEASAVAKLLAAHTGWNVIRSSIAVEGQFKPLSESNEEELLAALRSRRFVAEFDERLRLTIRPPQFGQWIGGLVLLAMGGGWLWLMAGAVSSFINDAQVKQQPIVQIPFWLLMTPMLMVGVGLCALGIAGFFGRERWTVDRNLVLVHSRLFGWRSEHEYVNARWKLARVRRATSKSQSYSVWQLQLENQSGGQLKVLRSDRDDDVPRLLGTLFSHRTGWPLQAENPI